MISPRSQCAFVWRVFLWCKKDTNTRTPGGALENNNQNNCYTCLLRCWCAFTFATFYCCCSFDLAHYCLARSRQYCCRETRMSCGFFYSIS